MTTELQWYERIIGEAQGLPVIGVYSSDEGDPKNYGRPVAVDVVWGDAGRVWVATDGPGVHVHMPCNSDEMTLSQYGTVREIVSSGIVEALIPFAQRFCNGPRNPEVVPPAEVLAEAAARRAEWEAKYPAPKPEPPRRPPLCELPEYPRILAACEALNAVFAEVEAREAAEEVAEQRQAA
jgi:hypothetical protein